MNAESSSELTGLHITSDDVVIIDDLPLFLLQADPEKIHAALPSPCREVAAEIEYPEPVQAILEKEGCEVLTADDGIDAFSLLKDNDVDLVVSNVDMPRMNGFTFTEKIHADSRLAKVPVVLVTSLDSPGDETHGYAVGADAYVIKSSFEKGISSA